MFTAIVWLRRDLRLVDHPALYHACQNHRHVLPVYVWEPDALGSAQKWWLHHSLLCLQSTYRDHGLPLSLQSGDVESVFARLFSQYPIKEIYWNHVYEPTMIARDQTLHDFWVNQGLGVHRFHDGLLHSPLQSTRAYRVFTPFWKQLAPTIPTDPALPAPCVQNVSIPSFPSDELDQWSLIPTNPSWASEFDQRACPGIAGADTALKDFLDQGVAHYAQGRNQLDIKGTSMLSPHIHFGEISIHNVWRAVHLDTNSSCPQGWEAYQRQLGWREFSYHLLYHTPTLPHTDIKSNLALFPWSDNQDHWRAWTMGQTGLPLVDAGMRQLWLTGWMHNRVRMITASFLTKNLRIHWTKGAAWFMDTLLDADTANNSAGWQWVAGCGADAAPYFRIFNPVTQGISWDSDATYIRQWVPELAHVPVEHIHSLPHLEQGVSDAYPRPVVSLAKTRATALAMYQRAQGEKSNQLTLGFNH